MPYSSFISLSNDLIEHALIQYWTYCDTTGDTDSDIKLFILGVLCYIGRAWVINDTEEADCVSR